jgi:hypothetical protein
VNGGPVYRLVQRALETRDRETLLEAFVAAARFGAAAPDFRDGLIDMPLPFDAAQRLGLDADALVEEAATHLSEHEEDFLRTFAGRADRDDVAAMGWTE